MLSKEVQVQAGELTADVVEFFAHQLLHHTVYHMKHHSISNKNGMLDPDYRNPWWMSLAGIKEKGTLTLAKAFFFPSKFVFPYFYETIERRADYYHEEHAAGHSGDDPNRIWDDLPNHALHHALQEGYWGVTNSTIDDFVRDVKKSINNALYHMFQKGYLGVTNSTMDNFVKDVRESIFGTAPEVDPERLERIKQIYVERWERSLPSVKAEAKRKRQEFEKKCMDVFNTTMDSLNYVSKKRWKLEHMVRDFRDKLPSLQLNF